MNIRKTLFKSIAVSVLALGFASCGSGSKSASSDARPLGETAAPAPRQSRQQQQPRANVPPPPTVEDVHNTRASLMGLNIPCGLGIGEGANDKEAFESAMKHAREELAKSVAVQTHRFSQTYALNVAEEARVRWEDRVALMTNADISNAPIYKSSSDHGRDGVFRVFTLVILDPARYKQALENATTGNDEFNRRAQKDILMTLMDAMIADFNSKHGIE